MENIDKIYWDNDSSLPISYRLGCYNNLFGFPYMTKEKLLKIDYNYQYYLNLSKSDLILNIKIYSFIESLKNNCSDINLCVTYILTPHSSSNILILMDNDIIPLKKVNEFWFCLSPNIESPQLILTHDLEKFIDSVDGEKYLLDLKFDPFPLYKDHIYDLSQILQVQIYIIKLLVCKPNGHFIEYFSYPHHPVKFLFEYIRSVTGYDNIKLIQKLNKNQKLTISDLDLTIKDLISQPSSNNLIFCELIKPSEYNI
jgi:hypothetical protein